MNLPVLKQPDRWKNIWSEIGKNIVKFVYIDMNSKKMYNVKFR